MTSTFAFIPDQSIMNLGIRGAYFVVGGMSNHNFAPELEALTKSAIERVRGPEGADAVIRSAALQGFRELHERVGVSNRKNISSPENLIGNVSRTGTFPHVNPIVDIYNAISLETQLALGAHDLERVEGNVHLRLTTGREKFVPLGSAEQKPVRSGAYAYIDDADDIICYLEVRQVEKTKVTSNTKECFYIIQGNAATELAEISAAMDRTIELTIRYCGGTLLYTSFLDASLDEAS